MGARKFTILHSNDIHGDFLSEVREGGGPLIGGLSLLSGYLNRVRREEENVLYLIAGDMVQGSLIDTEYKGISTIEIMNYLSPDAVTLGNHELDYGLSHLLFLEKMANFPIVNANLYIKKYGKRLMNPHVVLERAGFGILVTGIITEKVMDAISLDTLIGTFISLEDAAQEIGKIANAYRTSDIDLTIALTHIGHESDLELAAMLDPAWGVDMIIGGHSHTVLSEPARVNGILIAQAGTGTDQIGRYDITVDDDTNAITEWTWRLVPISAETAQPDENLKKFIDGYTQLVDRKNNAMVTRFADKLAHPRREEETPLGNLVADAAAERAEADVAMIGSGSIRLKELGPVVTVGALKACFPFADSLVRFKVTGAQLRRIFSHVMRLKNRDGEGECYQVNGAVRAAYSDGEERLVSLAVGGEPVRDDRTYTLALQNYHFVNSLPNLDITHAELTEAEIPKTVATSFTQALEEWMRGRQNQGRKVEGRLAYGE